MSIFQLPVHVLELQPHLSTVLYINLLGNPEVVIERMIDGM